MPTIHPSEDGTWFGRDPGANASFKQNLKQLTALTREWPGGRVGNYAGYTYWGQFIAHDIVPRAGLVEERTALLDLESLYGRPSREQERWWDPSAPMSEDGYFILGTTTKGRPADILRDGGIAMIPEPRNDHNLAIAQFHLLMQRTHNLIASRIQTDGASRAQKAKSLLTCLFHHLVRADYLPAICDADVLRFIDRNRILYVSPRAPLPPEFTHATFRFGHSMVRPSYQLQPGRPLATLQQMFNLTGDKGLQVHGGHHQQLPDEWSIDWGHFFHQGAGAIGPRTTSTMNNRDTMIVERNLEAGINENLSSGQAIAKRIMSEFPEISKETNFSQKLTTPDSNKAEILKATRTDDQIPLWLYILIESDFQHNGVQLGTLGSLIVAEVLSQVIDHVQLEFDIDEVFRVLGQDVPTMAALINIVDTEGNGKQ